MIDRLLNVEAPGAAGELDSIDAVGSPVGHPRVERRASDPAVLTYTSGTMGLAKGVLTCYGNLLFQIRSFCRRVGLT